MATASAMAAMEPIRSKPGTANCPARCRWPRRWARCRRGWSATCRPAREILSRLSAGDLVGRSSHRSTDASRSCLHRLGEAHPAGHRRGRFPPCLDCDRARWIVVRQRLGHEVVCRSWPRAGLAHHGKLAKPAEPAHVAENLRQAIASPAGPARSQPAGGQVSSARFHEPPRIPPAVRAAALRRAKTADVRDVALWRRSTTPIPSCSRLRGWRWGGSSAT